MESEQAIEALHPKMNQWSATFASVPNDVHRFAAIAERNGCKAGHHCHNHDFKGNANVPSVAGIHTIREKCPDT